MISWLYKLNKFFFIVNTWETPYAILQDESFIPKSFLKELFQV